MHSSEVKGRFIVIEGLEGAGKSTAHAAVVDTLKQWGVAEICNTREPGGTAMAEAIRELFKRPPQNEPVSATTELMLMYASRVQLVDNVVKPALARGAWVVGDRHDLSTQAYQGGGRQLDAEMIAQLKQFALGEFAPDLTLLLDLPPALGLARARGRGELDRIEQQDLSFFERTRARYLALAERDSSIQVIDASRSLAEVTSAIQACLAQQRDRLWS